MTGKSLLTVFFCLLALKQSLGLDNGLALTPPMGWLSWERFRCNTDCNRDPEDCISDYLIRSISDKMVEDGYLDAGYQYVIIDDCWLSPDRDENGRLQPDPERFPNGIKDLADYVHSKGLKFGIYEDYGTKTCAGYPGLIGHLEIDAQTFAEWGVDYLKIDGCNVDSSEFDTGYPEFGKYLNQTGRPIVYSCEWGLYQENSGKEPDYAAISDTCNLNRNWYDIEDSYTSFKSIAEHMADRQDAYAKWARPGYWNDPDMLIIGNYGLSFEQAKAQMAIWSVLSAPLIMSHDVRNVRAEFRDILQNPGAIGINQDPLGHGGMRLSSKDNIDVWAKPILPEGSLAVAVVSKREDGAPYWVSITTEALGLSDGVYKFTEVFGSHEDKLVSSDSPLEVRVPPTGALLYRAEPQNLGKFWMKRSQ